MNTRVRSLPHGIARQRARAFATEAVTWVRGGAEARPLRVKSLREPPWAIPLPILYLFIYLFIRCDTMSAKPKAGCCSLCITFKRRVRHQGAHTSMPILCSRTTMHTSAHTGIRLARCQGAISVCSHTPAD